MATRGVTSHPANGLDDIVHQRVRLGILATAHEARRVEFGYLRTNLELSAGNLSQHLGVLENAGLITIEKGYAGKRARTWVSLTRAGRAALAAEITHLKLLISLVERSSPPDPTASPGTRGARRASTTMRSDQIMPRLTP
jgi:DNA-binding MarR family transcriptional regulator